MLYQLSYAHRRRKIITRRRARGLCLAGEGNWQRRLAPRRALPEMCARLRRPGAVGRVTEIEQPFVASEAAVATLFVGESEIEMNIRVRGQGAGSAAQMVDRFLDLA